MIEVNKPIDTTPNVRCYKCKSEFYVHPLVNMNAPYITDCELHNPSCEHESDGDTYGHIQKGREPSYLCIKCGEFYR